MRRQTPGDMEPATAEVGGDMQDDMEDDIAADIAGGDEASSGEVDEPLGPIRKETNYESC